MERISDTTKAMTDINLHFENLEVYQTQMEDLMGYYDQLFENILKRALEVESLLHMQVFSQRMVENLINDLLDLAKLENNSFNISNEYFDLAATIYEAFQILAYQATDQMIDLKAKIDFAEHLKMMRSVYGDRRRFL